MLITSCQIKNYKSFKDSEEFKFTSGFNVIVGRNNVGKTALIEALSLTINSIPHKSVETLRTSDSRFDQVSTVTSTFNVEPQEFEGIMAKHNAIFVPCQPSEADIAAAERFLEVMDRPLQFRFTYSNGDFRAGELTGFGKCAGPNKARLDYDPATSKFAFKQRGLYANHDHDDTFARPFGSGLRERIYLFKAERMNISESSIVTSPLLSPNAGNLPGVLHLLQSTNPVRFRRFNRDVTTVFPEIKQVTAQPVSNAVARILIWTVDPETEREDLAVPLSDCGTGIGQVLAMLYVVTNSDVPRTIIVDEPQSFLHPGAIRKLFEIFKRYPQHQFIISTHSPTAVTAANPKTIILLRREGNETKSEVLSISETCELRLFLSEIGARLSDVFGADNILWVEGRTEEVCFRIIIERVLKSELLGTEIIGVKHTSDFDRRSAKTALDVYQRLSEGKGLLPPALAFVFDRENRSAKDMEDLEERIRGRVLFLQRRMYESYLLNLDAIAAVLTELDKSRSEPITTAEVIEWLNKNGRKYNYSASTDTWHKKADAAEILNQMFNELTETRVCYDKVRHAPKLTEWIVQNSPSDLNELASVLEKALKGLAV